MNSWQHALLLWPGLETDGPATLLETPAEFGAPDRGDGLAWLPPRRPSGSVGRGA